MLIVFRLFLHRGMVRFFLGWCWEDIQSFWDKILLFGIIAKGSRSKTEFNFRGGGGFQVEA